MPPASVSGLSVAAYSVRKDQFWITGLPHPTRSLSSGTFLEVEPGPKQTDWHSLEEEMAPYEVGRQPPQPIPISPQKVCTMNGQKVNAGALCR